MFTICKVHKIKCRSVPIFSTHLTSYCNAFLQFQYVWQSLDVQHTMCFVQASLSMAVFTSGPQEQSIYTMASDEHPDILLSFGHADLLLPDAF